MSKLRLKAEKERMAILEGDPLRARMRVSDVDPPLTTIPRETTDIAIKIELMSEVRGASKLSVSVNYNSSANAAIGALLRRMRKLTGHRDLDSTPVADSGDSENRPLSRARGSTIRCASADFVDDGEVDEANEWVLLVPGMDEVLAGKTPLVHFVAVRQCLLSRISSPILNLVLERKATIIEQIRNREMNDNRLLPESRRSSNYTPIRLKGQAVMSPEMMPGLQHHSVSQWVSVFLRCCSDVPARVKAKTLVLVAALVHGTSLLCETVSTKKVPGNATVLFNELLEFQCKICSLPRAARFSFTLYDADRAEKKPKAVATLNFPVFSFDGWMNTGQFECRMWLDRGFDFF
jgi:phosphatidylinositol-4,5-bisphosphate 3-kinase